MSAEDQKYQREMLKQIARRLSEAALDRADLRRLSRQLKFWFANMKAPAAQIAATRVEDACRANLDALRLAPRVWALEHEVMRLLRFVNWSPAQSPS